MALQFFDGFDDYPGFANNSALAVELFANNYNVNFNSIDLIAGLFGGNGINVWEYGNSQNWEMLRIVPTPSTSFIAGVRVYVSGAGATGALTFRDSAGGIIAYINIVCNGSTSTLTVINHAGTTIATVSNAKIAQGLWTYLEAICTPGASGSLQIFVAGVLIYNGTGLSIAVNTGANICYVGMYQAGQNLVYFDDLYGCDTTGAAPFNTVLTAVAGVAGPRVYTVQPNSNNQSGWTPLSGTSNVAMVDEVQFDGDSSYVFTTIAGSQDLYGIPAIAGITDILAVQTSCIARMDDSGTREVSMSIESGGTIYQGQTITMSGAYQKWEDIYINDPNTGSAWLPSKFTSSGNIFIGPKCVE
jgi:hypothetical protein